MEYHTQMQIKTNTISIIVKKTFGDQLRIWRKAKGMTQKELAKASGVNASWISNLERNFSANKPTADTAESNLFQSVFFASILFFRF